MFVLHCDDLKDWLPSINILTFLSIGTKEMNLRRDKDKEKGLKHKPQSHIASK